MLKIKTDSNNQIDIENKSIEISDKVSADGEVTIATKTPTEIKIIKAKAVKSVISDDAEVELKDTSSVRKVVSVIRGIISENIASHNNSGSGSGTSDEFTYTKTPGSIPKIFFHIGTHEQIVNTDYNWDDYNENRELNETEQWIVDHLQATTDDESVFVFVDADGVERYELGKFSTDSYNKKEALASFYSISRAIPDKTIVVNTAGLTTATNADTIADILANDSKLAEELNSGKYNSYDGSVYNRLMGAHITVVSSDLLYNNDWDKDLLIPYGYDSFIHYSTLLAGDSKDNKEDSSSSYKGMYIIDKAVEEGRALDLFVDVNNNETIVHTAALQG